MAKTVLTIAIDFGTAYSGYHVKCNTPGKGAQFRDVQWGEEYGIRSCKTPTCALFDNTDHFVDFGYAAMKKYTSKGFQDGYFFENFKMDLYKNKVIQSDLQVTATNGKQMPAMTVFTESLRYLKDHVLRKVENFSKVTKLRNSDITWVLTVPAIWSNAAKQFMRDVAIKAGLVTDSDPERLILALEPEAAAIYCKELPSDGFVGGEEDTMRLDQMPGTQYIVADCGGGTIDITLHEVLDGGALKEVSKASGNDLGGQNIDRQLKSFLKEIFGDEVWKEYETRHAPELQKLLYEFAFAKCADENDGYSFPCQYNLIEIVKEKHGNKTVQELLKGHPGVTWNDGSIDISAAKFRSFFDESLRGIAGVLRDFLKNQELHIRYLVMVGGFAMSKILQNYIKHQFGNTCEVLCPQHPQQAIMVGAADFGSQPEIVQSRISALTYGVDTSKWFNETKHKIEKKYTNCDGEEFCKDLFKRLVRKGESVGYNETRNFTFHPVTREQKEMAFTFYSTDRPNAIYIDEWGVDEMATMIVPLPNPSGPRLDREVRLDLKFGFTEIIAIATDLKSNKSERIILHFMRE
ncbi:heat shock 70 kDa protein 12A-like [Engraulis encrasicolus]|uniref:heat shock 70 kDa protein 12A-like n=1 Tax=Engraulis encrasicolus TaxID=184585 RepID=UPI002FD7537A